MNATPLTTNDLLSVCAGAASARRRQEMIEMTRVVTASSQRPRVVHQHFLARTIVHVLQVYNSTMATLVVTR